MVLNQNETMQIYAYFVVSYYLELTKKHDTIQYWFNVNTHSAVVVHYNSSPASLQVYH